MLDANADANTGCECKCECGMQGQKQDANAEYRAQIRTSSSLRLSNSFFQCLACFESWKFHCWDLDSLFWIPWVYAFSS